MTDIRKLLEDTVQDAYERQGGGDYSPTPEVRARILRRGRRRRVARVAGALALIVAVAGVAWASVDVLRRDAKRIDPADVPRLGAERVMEFGGPLAGDADSLWVANGRITNDAGDRESVARLDQETGRVTDGPPAIGPILLNVAFGPSGLWAVGWTGDMPVGEGGRVRGSISLVDLESLEVVQEIPREDSAPYDVAAGEVDGREVAWVTDYGRDELLKVDAETGEIEALAVQKRPTAVTVGAGTVWVAGRKGVITRYDPSDGSLTEFSVDKCATDIAVTADSVWVADFCLGVVHRLDAADGKEIATIEFSKGESFIFGNPLAIAQGLVWVATPTDIVRIDPQSNSVVGESVAAGEHPEYITAAGDTIFVSSWDGVYRLDPNAPVMEPYATLATEDEEDVEKPQACSAKGVTCIPIDRETSLVGYGFGSAWVANIGEGKTFGIARFDAETGEETARLRTGGFVQALVPDVRWMWALLEGGEPDELTLLKIDPATNEVLERHGLGSAGNIGQPSLVADGTFVWVSGPGGSLMRVNGEDGSLDEVSYADQLPGYGIDNGPLKLAHGEGLVWLSYGNGNLGVVDPQTMELLRVDEGALGVNAYDILVTDGYVWSSHQSPKGDAVFSYSPTDGRPEQRGKVLIPEQGHPGAQAIGAARVWVIQQGFEERGPSWLVGVDPRKQEVVGEPIELDIFFQGTIAVGDGYVWVTGNQVLYRIMP